MDCGGCQADLTRSEIRRQAGAEAYNRRELARELRLLLKPARRILELGAGGEFSRFLLGGILRPEQAYCGLGGDEQALLALSRRRGSLKSRVLRLDLLDRSCAAEGEYDLIIAHRRLADLPTDPRDVLAYVECSLVPGGRFILLEEALDGVAEQAGDLLYRQCLAELERLRGREVYGPRRLDDYLSLAAGAGLEATRRCLIGQDPGPCRNKILAARLRRERMSLAGSLPEEERRAAERLLDEAAVRIAGIAPGRLPLALIVMEKPGGSKIRRRRWWRRRRRKRAAGTRTKTPGG